MGGDVTVASEPGKGSVFTVRLPAGAAPLAKTASGSTNGRPPVPIASSSSSMTRPRASYYPIISRQKDFPS
jgi:hypothetical protein